VSGRARRAGGGWWALGAGLPSRPPRTRPVADPPAAAAPATLTTTPAMTPTTMILRHRPIPRPPSETIHGTCNQGTYDSIHPPTRRREPTKVTFLLPQTHDSRPTGHWAWEPRTLRIPP